MSKLEKYREQIIETENRWVVFIDKLKERTIELCEASIPELINEYEKDPDEYKRTYHTMVSGIVGQLNSIEQKASEVYHQNIYKFFDKIEDKVDEDEELSELASDASERCSDLSESFDEFIDKWTEKIKEAKSIDYEVEYQTILDEHEQIKNKFCCKQCGSVIPINKILFLITHLECPACQTQNTFTPSSKAAKLEHMGRQLAEQRTEHLYKAYQAEYDKDTDIYNQIHNLELTIGFDDNHPNAASVKAQIAELEAKRKQAKVNAPKLHKKYLRAKFDELNKIVPDLKEQNEKVYLRHLKDNHLENVDLD